MLILQIVSKLQFNFITNIFTAQTTVHHKSEGCKRITSKVKKKFKKNQILFFNCICLTDLILDLHIYFKSKYLIFLIIILMSDGQKVLGGPSFM